MRHVLAHALRRRLAMLVAVVQLTGAAGAATGATLPPRFQETTVLHGLTAPTNVEFSPDGRVFVAEQRGLIKVFESLDDPLPEIFADLSNEVYAFWDRGLLGLALDPGFPQEPYVYALYTRDAPPGGSAPFWGSAGIFDDPCPSPPGPTANGCLVSGRLVRLTATGNIASASSVLVDDWCQQYPSHSVGDLAFGPDGALYASAGDGANFVQVDYGQGGQPPNPCADPGAPAGLAPSPPTAEGGALRSQDIRSGGDPTGLDGSVIRVDRASGAASPGNATGTAPDPNARRIVATGLRNPFRLAVRPGSDELWLGDVGWNDVEEIDVLRPGAPLENFGWPCYEGDERQAGYDTADLDLCESLYAAPAAHARPLFGYAHEQAVVPGDGCPGGSGSITGLAFYENGSFPAAYRGALFFADYARSCIWAMLARPGEAPDPASTELFAADAPGLVDLEAGPGGDLFAVDIERGRVQRFRYHRDNIPPLATISVFPANGPLPLSVTFDGSGSSDADPDEQLSFAWDLDGDGAFDDAEGPRTSWTYDEPVDVAVGLRVTDTQLASATARLTVSPGNTPPRPAIEAPRSSSRWSVGQTIAFAGQADDAEQGTIAAASLHWTLELHHCDESGHCHTHVVREWSGVGGGSLVAPDHEYPSFLVLTLTATDARGLAASESLRLDPVTATLSLETAPRGLRVVIDGELGTAPLSRRVIAGSSHTISTPTPQRAGGRELAFSEWSNGRARTQTVVAVEGGNRVTARFSEIAARAATGARVDGVRRLLRAVRDGYVISGERDDHRRERRLVVSRRPASTALIRFRLTGMYGRILEAKLLVWVVRGSRGVLVSGGGRFPVGGRHRLGGWVEIDATAAAERARLSGARSLTFRLRLAGTGTVRIASQDSGRRGPQLALTSPR